MTRQPHIPPADWSPRTARDLLQLGNDSTNGVVARLLELRGISDNLTSSFFHPSLEELHDPSEMRHMDRAVDRIMTAQRNGECIMAYGDYDVDGATSVSLIHDFLRNNGFEVLPYIPDRYSEGYGLSSQGVQRAAESGCSIIITLDCGIRATERVAEANALGIDVIICDHHLPGETLPEAFAILNPKHPECQYPFKELSGCGVAFKLTQGLTERIGLSPMSAYDGLDLVALSIASDLVEVTGENRILLHHGLKAISKNARPGIRALLQVVHCSPEYLTVRDIISRISPRINAAGRMSLATEAVELLTEKSDERANELAGNLDRLNQVRRSYDEQITRDAIAQLSDREEFKHVNIVWGKGWHRGVIGIVATRLIEHRYRPSIVISDDNGVMVGSARSTPGLDIHEIIKGCSEYLEQFGGHAMAAGITVKTDQAHAFAKALDEAVGEKLATISKREPRYFDLEIRLQDCTPELLRKLRTFEPYGPGAPAPVFLSRDVKLAVPPKTVGKEGRHLRISMKVPGAPQNLTAVGFGLGHRIDALVSTASLDVVFKVETECYRGVLQPRITLLDFWSERH
ncbi:MAG TPA: single-stranded-DNA-specific exonuclease RecJ [Flavobacteriales bacterium]|jgi:single-stranded-DNA-specific exonuclease|nr:single-stranded-DNA-specific exonuclease RecJ [Flavobacteriales bacterium]